MIQQRSVSRVRYDTRMYCGITYTQARTARAMALPLQLHLISPIGGGERFPLLVYIGGGGWRISAPDRHLPELAFFAENGFTVASIGYRTTAHDGFPAQIEDVRTAIRFLRLHADQFHIDPEHVYVCGGSAGAYLAAMAALTGGRPKFRGAEYPDIPDTVSGAICLYGIYDFPKLMVTLSTEKNTEGQAVVWEFLKNQDMLTLIEASPTYYIAADSVPFLLLHGTEDRLVPHQQSILFHDQLTQSQVPAELVLLEGAGHASPDFSQPEIQSLELEFLKNNLQSEQQRSGLI